MYIECPDMTENKKIAFQTSINDEIFTFVFKWNEYCGCCFLDILDNNRKSLNCGNALVTNSAIFTKRKILPKLIFVHKEGLELEPTPETIKDYVIYYADSTKQ